MRLSKLGSLQFLQLARFGTLMLGSIVIARLLPKNIVAEYENMVLVGSSLSFFWVSGIINTFIPFFQHIETRLKRELVGLVFFMLSALAILAATIAWIFNPALFQGELLPYGLYLIFAFFSAAAFFTEYLFFSLKKPRALFIYTLFSQGSQLAAIVLPLLLNYSLTTAIFCLAIVGFLRFAFLTFLVSRFAKLPSTSLTKDFIFKAWPVSLSLLIGGSMLYLDSYIVRHYFNDEAFAIFQYGARELPFVLLLANALSNVGSAEISLANKKGNLQKGLQYVKIRSRRLIFMLFPLSILLLIFSRQLFSFFYTEAFADSAMIFDIYLLLIISRLVFPQTVLLALHKNKTLLWASTGEWIVKLALNLILIQQFGILGIAFATVIAYLFEKIIHAYILHRQKIPLVWYTPLKSWLIFSIVLIAVFVTKYLLWETKT